MLFTETNLRVSFTLALATYLRAAGYDVFWHETQETESQTAGLVTARGTVTIVRDLPANPTYIVRLKGDSAGQEEVVVPVMTVRVLGAPRRLGGLGIGHAEADWEREIRIDGFAADEFQQAHLVRLLHEWLNASYWQAMEIRNHEDVPGSPPVVGQVYVSSAPVEGRELNTTMEAVRYYFQALVVVQYEE